MRLAIHDSVHIKIALKSHHLSRMKLKRKFLPRHINYIKPIVASPNFLKAARSWVIRPELVMLCLRYFHPDVRRNSSANTLRHRAVQHIYSTSPLHPCRK